ncbi:hypothetical protein PPL_09890 [Heterostelium album PN500]|uniref:Uncharacterized protein n=1 Tax=Heterostelium pallidum (strain ATCC 26659 / Pp 5 / PN500) TaxID=670386 RepID=D3BPC5_HETP5|nr:hypothetical protein PPL_09890 [Heterostelium album PN500]EFA77135.1 hypothetical protein PPL_09890 [Heterostelium album PN500]|eukprot:XP_020429264.1 hypothetical protein PPL_09890 [Heterostelium album PN500]
MEENSYHSYIKIFWKDISQTDWYLTNKNVNQSSRNMLYVVVKYLYSFGQSDFRNGLAFQSEKDSFINNQDNDFIEFKTNECIPRNYKGAFGFAQTLGLAYNDSMTIPKCTPQEYSIITKIKDHNICGFDPTTAKKFNLRNFVTTILSLGRILYF